MVAMTVPPIPATVLQLSDTHLRARPGIVDSRRDSPDAALTATVNAVQIVGARPDLVVLTGDLADDGSKAALLRLRTELSVFACPVLALAGNHDHPAAVTDVFGSAAPIEIAGWRVLPLDTAVPGREDGEIEAAEVLRRLDELSGMPTMLVMHHPPDSPSTHPIFGLVGGSALLDGLRTRPHVRLVATGHLHQSFDRADGQLTIVGAPSTWFALDHEAPHYRLVTDGVVGARVWTLAPDGTASHRVVSRRVTPLRMLAPGTFPTP
jgi:3',5'-cyclic-AMP phosphodiesterase